jgi:signal transduction histidine kinase
MPVREITEIERLQKINAALISRVERSTDQQGNAFSLFQTAINLEHRVRARTEELEATLRRLADSNIDLQAAKEAAEQANLSKTRFLAAASHDVLQPLNAAHLSISALADLQTTDDGRRLVGQVERSLTTITSLLQTLLDISRLDAKVMTPDVSDVSLDQLFSSIKSDFLPLAEQRGLKFHFRKSGAMVRSDRTMLRRILQNIVSNSMRYTQRGGVLVGARRRGPVISIEVADTGCGIEESQREAIFEEFHRGPNNTNTDVSSAGLGLSIVRRMTEALGHRLSFSSVVGRGTIFRVAVPAVAGNGAKAPQGGEAPPSRGYGLFGTRVLLIEDDADVRDAMTALLERWECVIRCAASSAEAMRIVAREKWLPDIIIADQHLRHGDFGSQTIAELRAHLDMTIPALIVTGDACTALSDAAQASNIQLMRKPIKPAHLRALMAHLLA